MSKQWIPTVEDELSLSGVTRWHLVDTLKTQSVAEHSYNVMVIARAIYDSLPVTMASEPHSNGVPIKMADVLYLAMNHDLDEVMTGDIPSPTKRYLREQTKSLSDFALGKIMGGDHVPQWGVDNRVDLIVKLADKIEACWYINNYYCGNRSKGIAREVESRTWRDIDDYRKNDDSHIGSIHRSAYFVLRELMQGQRCTKIEEVMSNAT